MRALAISIGPMQELQQLCPEAIGALLEDVYRPTRQRDSSVGSGHPNSKTPLSEAHAVLPAQLPSLPDLQAAWLLLLYCVSAGAHVPRGAP